MKPDSDKREATGTSKTGINNALKKVDEMVKTESVPKEIDNKSDEVMEYSKQMKYGVVIGDYTIQSEVWWSMDG